MQATIKTMWKRQTDKEKKKYTGLIIVISLKRLLHWYSSVTIKQSEN